MLMARLKKLFSSVIIFFFVKDRNMNMLLTSFHFYSLSSKTAQHLHLQMEVFVYVCMFVCMFVCL